MESKSIAQLYREALAVQDACNLSGVAQSFARAMIDLGEHCRTGTEERNAHLIVSLWLDKMLSLNHYSDEKVSRAYKTAYYLTDEVI